MRNGIELARETQPGRFERIEVVDNFSPGEGDFKMTAAKIKNRSLDVLGVYLISGQVSAFYRQAGQMGFTDQLRRECLRFRGIDRQSGS